MEIKISVNDRLKKWHKKDDENYWHREDGPALIVDDTAESWWYYDIPYTTRGGIHEHEKMPLNLFLAYCKWEYRKNEK